MKITWAGSRTKSPPTAASSEIDANDGENNRSRYSANIDSLVHVNSLTAISCYGGEKHQNPVGFYSRNSTESTLQDKHNNHKHHHHGGAVCPSFGVGSMDPPDRTHVTSSEEVGRGGWCKRFN